MKLPNKYISIDLETTDSDSAIGEAIQIGAVVVNEDLSLGAEFTSYIKPLTTHRNPEAMTVNGISEETLANAPAIHDVLSAFEVFALSVGERPQLAAWGAYFDVVFLRETYKKINRDYPFSYRCLDLKTVAIWEMAKRGQSPSGGVQKFLKTLGLEFEGTAHSALDDIKNTMRIIQQLTKKNE